MAEQHIETRTPQTAGERFEAEILERLQQARAEGERRLAGAGPLAELTQAGAPGPFDWEVVAWGPWQSGNSYDDPGRIIFTGERAYIAVAVLLTPGMAQNLGGLAASISLGFHTSNMQRMQPGGPSLQHNHCIEIKEDQLFYVYVWEFTADEAACLYEMNICARVCNCRGKTVRRYAGFVRQVFDFDPEHLGFVGGAPVPGWQFDRPIRFLVADPTVDCPCS